MKLRACGIFLGFSVGVSGWLLIFLGLFGFFWLVFVCVCVFSRFFCFFGWVLRSAEMVLAFVVG